MRVKESFFDLGVQDQRLKDLDLSLLDFMKSIPFEYTRIDEVKAWLYFGRDLLVWLGGLYFGYQLGLIPVWSWFHFVFGVFVFLMVLFSYVGFFTLGHECGHFVFSKSRRMNLIVGQFVFGLTHIGFHNWKISHNFHHTFSQCMGKDTTWTKGKWTTAQFQESDLKARKDYLIGYSGPVGILIGYYFAVVQYVWFTKFHPFIPLVDEQKWQLRKSNWSALFFTLVHFGVYYYLGGWPFYLGLHILPLMVGAVFVVGVPLLQHAHGSAVYFDSKNWSPLRGQILGTYNFRMPYVFERIFKDVNLHIVHHLSPKVPWYNLRPAYDGLKKKYPEFVLEYDLQWNSLLTIFQRPLAELDSRYNFYRAAPVPEDLKPQA